MRLLDWLDKMLPGSAVQTTAGHTDNIRQRMVEDIAKRALAYEQLAVPLSGKHDWKGLGIIDDPYMDEAQKGKCLWCTVPYEDDSGTCTKCGAPKDIEEVEAVALMVCSTSCA